MDHQTLILKQLCFCAEGFKYSTNCLMCGRSIDITYNPANESEYRNDDGNEFDYNCPCGNKWHIVRPKATLVTPTFFNA